MCDVEALLLALKLASGHLHKSDDNLIGPHMVNAIYLPPEHPVDRLRREAKEMEKRDADIQSIRDLLVKCEPKN
jgi:hypothetical protein